MVRSTLMFTGRQVMNLSYGIKTEISPRQFLHPLNFFDKNKIQRRKTYLKSLEDDVLLKIFSNFAHEQSLACLFLLLFFLSFSSLQFSSSLGFGCNYGRIPQIVFSFRERELRYFGGIRNPSRPPLFLLLFLSNPPTKE